jgi:molybdenum cofactor cytidylyltransferase
MSQTIDALVLAAGESRRMGEPKQLLAWGTHTIIEQIVETLISAPVDEIVVVLGHCAEEVDARLAAAVNSPSEGPAPRTRPLVRTVVNPDYRAGMLTSLQHGIRALDKRTRAVFIVLCDQPQMKLSTLLTLRAAFESSGRGIVVPSHNMRRGHPLLIDLRKYREEILALDGAPGLQNVLRSHSGDILHVEFDDPGVLADLDTPEDYRQARREA